MNAITVATFNTELAALPLLQRLTGAGIQARISNQKAVQRLWFMAKPYAAFHLEVSRDDLERVNELLARWQAEEAALSEALRCPECGSLRVEYPQMSRKFALPTLIAHSLVWCGLMRHEFVCTECQHTWPWPTKVGQHPLKTPAGHGPASPALR
ncbi:MAG TPA: hypothetical protein VMB21_03680 [Candidatus Limnocylindria bacterium]|nr:hypothetical protein [Candidatus Limnocylindria bacterium]